jgi:hypothetical protein
MTLEKHNDNDMETITRTGTTLNTRVEIAEITGTYRATMKQDIKDETDVLACKTFNTIIGARNWANKVLA